MYQRFSYNKSSHSEKSDYGQSSPGWVAPHYPQGSRILLASCSAIFKGTASMLIFTWRSQDGCPPPASHLYFREKKGEVERAFQVSHLAIYTQVLVSLPSLSARENGKCHFLAGHIASLNKLQFCESKKKGIKNDGQETTSVISIHRHQFLCTSWSHIHLYVRDLTKSVFIAVMEVYF